MRRKRSYRVQLGFLVGALYLWIAEPSPESFIIGAVCMVLGETLRIVSAGTLVKYDGVTRDGIYTYTRNPLYIGSFLIGTGACIMGKNFEFTLLFLLLFFYFYTRTIAREERFLSQRYGKDYLQYISEVPRFIPNHFSIRTVLSSVHISQAIRNREHLTILGIFALLVIMIVKIII